MNEARELQKTTTGRQGTLRSVGRRRNNEDVHQSCEYDVAGVGICGAPRDSSHVDGEDYSNASHWYWIRRVTSRFWESAEYDLVQYRCAFVIFW